MTIVAKIGETEMYTPREIKTTGVFKKKHVQAQDFVDLNKVIQHIQEKFGDQYQGLFDLFEFQIEGKNYPLWSKCTYEEIFSWSQLGKDGSTHAFDKKDEGTWEWRKHLRTSSLSTAIYKNPEGSDTEYSIGQPDPEIDAKIMYDSILYGLVSTDRFLQDDNYEKFSKMFDNTIEFLKVSKKTHDITDWNDFNLVLEYFESRKLR